jgi:hypothetical protein
MVSYVLQEEILVANTNNNISFIDFISNFDFYPKSRDYNANLGRYKSSDIRIQ